MPWVEGVVVQNGHSFLVLHAKLHFLQAPTLGTSRDSRSLTNYWAQLALQARIAARSGSELTNTRMCSLVDHTVFDAFESMSWESSRQCVPATKVWKLSVHVKADASSLQGLWAL